MISKLIQTGDFNTGDEPVSLLLNTYSEGFDRDQLQKRAAMFDDRLEKIAIRKDKGYIHLITTGAMEFYGSNKNGDSFPERSREYIIPHPEKGIQKVAQLGGGLIEYHDRTFMKEGATYKNHKNRTKKGTPNGHIKLAAYNPHMHRGELIVELDLPEWEPELQKMANNEPVYFSMGCAIECDLCSYCGRRSRTRTEYCNHLKTAMLSMDPEGNIVSAINDTPIFHDISGVFRPADKISYGLRTIGMEKTASFAGADYYNELENLWVPESVLKQVMDKNAAAKLELLRKLAAMEKEIELTHKKDPDKDMTDAFKPGSGFGETDNKRMERLSHKELGDVLGACEKEHILLPPEDLMKVILGPDYGDAEPHMPKVKQILPDVFRDMLDEGNLMSVLGDDSYEPGKSIKDRGVLKETADMAESHSLAPEPVKIRIIRITMRGNPHKGGDRVDNAAAGAGRDLHKEGSDYRAARVLAREYAKYQLAFLHKCADANIMRLTLAHNRATVD